jgi:hypothetical protein
LPRSASAAAKPIPASTTQATNADWKPSVSAASGFAPAFAARKASEREMATLETIATPSAAPSCRAVLLRPDASPASS